MTNQSVRTSRLGGEIRRRGLLGGARSRTGNGVLAGALVTAMVFALFVGGLAGIVVAVVLFGGAFVITRQNPVTGRSSGRELALALRWRQRQWRGETDLLPAHLATPQPAPRTRAERRAARRWARSVRDETPGLEGVEWLDPDGVGPAVLLHHPAGQAPYLTVAIEVDGQPSGLRSQREYDRASAAYGRLLARLARGGGLIAGVQSLTHIVPLDSAAHERWAADHIDTGAPPVLMRSYAELVRMTAGVSEMVRHYLVLRLPLTLRYVQEAARYGTGEAGQVALAISQAEWVSSLALGADLRNPRLMTNHRLAALLRHLQNPDFPIDETVDVSARTWLRRLRATREAAVVDERWFHRVAAIPRSAVTPEPVGARWLAPLLHGGNTPVVRTISLSVTVQPAARARRQAREDLTVDLGSRNEAARRGTIDDGTQAVQASASAQRLADLQPGSGIHGAQWAGWIAVAATSMDDVLRASTTIADAAGDSGIGYLDWLDRRHDEALPVTWPVWRGMEVRQ